MANRRGERVKTLKGPEERLDVFPAFVKVADRRVLVVGHGGEAAAKVRLLGETNAQIVVIAKEIEADLSEAIELFQAEHVAEDFRPAHLTNAALVFSAREDWDLDKAVVGLQLQQLGCSVVNSTKQLVGMRHDFGEHPTERTMWRRVLGGEPILETL